MEMESVPLMESSLRERMYGLEMCPFDPLASLLTLKMVVRKGRVEKTDRIGLHLSTSTSLQKS